MTAPLLQIAGLAVDYGAVRALHDVSLSVAAGNVVSLVGSNGAGKSTTLRAVSGLVPLASGSILFDGEEVTALPPDRRVARGIAHVPEGRHVFAGMSVRENLLLGAYSRSDQVGVDGDIQSMVELFPILGERWKQRAGTLSGGEQQMLAIARGLVSRPELLIMDEPTMGLAPQMIDAILDKLAAIVERGATILLVEQNAVEAIRLSDEVYVMRLGRIVHHGTGASIDAELLKALYLGHEV